MDIYDNNKLSGRMNQRMLEKNIQTGGEYKAKVSGDFGEYEISSVLKSLPDCYHIMNNILLKTKKGSTQLDHVIVSPFGVFVVETKNHKGMIFGDTMGRVWTQVLRNGAHNTFYSPVLQNAGHMENLYRHIGLKRELMTGMIVFTNPEADLRNVNCPFCMRTESLYEAILSYDRQVFTEKQMYEVIKRIDSVNTSSYLNDRKHVEYVKSIKERKERLKNNRK